MTSRTKALIIVNAALALAVVMLARRRSSQEGGDAGGDWLGGVAVASFYLVLLGLALRI